MVASSNKQNVGIKIAEPGYDATTAPDYNLLFNSSWKQLPIIHEYTATVTATLSGGKYSYPPIKEFVHNLGFYALADLWITNDPFAPSTIKTTRKNLEVYIGKNSVVWYATAYQSFPTDPGPITVHINVYNIDLSVEASYDYIQPNAASRVYDHDYGLKVAREGKAIDSTDMRDYILHTRCQSPAILTIINQDSSKLNAYSIPYIEYVNPQGYTNWVYGYVQQSNHAIMTFLGATGGGDYYQMAAAQAQAYPTYNFIDGRTYQLLLGYGSTAYFPGSLVVLRDPLIVPDQVEVTY